MDFGLEALWWDLATLVTRVIFDKVLRFVAKWQAKWSGVYTVNQRHHSEMGMVWNLY